MSTLEELKAQRDAIDNKIEQFEKGEFWLITQRSEVLSLDYKPTWVGDETLLYPRDKWFREEVERIAAACLQLRKSFISAKNEGEWWQKIGRCKLIEGE